MEDEATGNRRDFDCNGKLDTLLDTDDERIQHKHIPHFCREGPKELLTKSTLGGNCKNHIPSSTSPPERFWSLTAMRTV
jgi:hypothetical protein